MDLAFIVDASTSICGLTRCRNWDFNLEFIRNVTKSMDIGPDQNRIGLLTFANDAVLTFHLNTWVVFSPYTIYWTTIQYKLMQYNTAITVQVCNLRVRPIIYLCRRYFWMFLDGVRTHLIELLRRNMDSTILRAQFTDSVRVHLESVPALMLTVMLLWRLLPMPPTKNIVLLGPCGWGKQRHLPPARDCLVLRFACCNLIACRSRGYAVRNSERGVYYQLWVAISLLGSDRCGCSPAVTSSFLTTVSLLTNFLF